MLDRVLLDEEADGIGRFALQMTFPDIEHLVEETAHVEAQAQPVFVGELAPVFAGEQPAAV